MTKMDLMNNSSEKIFLTRTSIERVHRYKTKKILKVIGASWLQTKITAYVLIAISVFGIVAIILAEIGSYSSFVEDGNYAATVFWRSKVGFRIDFWGQGNDLNEVLKGCGRAYYRPDMPNTGWSILEIETMKEYPDWVQAFAAGLLEGSLTWQAIYWQYENTIQPYCENNEENCEIIRTILKEKTEDIRSTAEQLGKTDPFWYQIDLFYKQLDGLETGWYYAVKRSRQDVEMDKIDFLWLNILSILNNDEFIVNETNPFKDVTVPSTAFIKLLQSSTNERKINIAHNSAGKYNFMLRLLKRYKFNYHHKENDQLVVPGNIITFTSYPGSLSSQDEFYIITSSEEKHNIIVTGSSKNNLDNNILGTFYLKNNTLLGPRVMAANRIAKNGQEWVAIMNKSKSDTDDKQWLITDLSKINSEPIEKSGLLWVMEQNFGAVNADDQSEKLIKNGYWVNFNQKDYHNIEDIIKTNLMQDEQEIKYTSQKMSSPIDIVEKHDQNHTMADFILQLMRNISLSPSAALRKDLSIDNPLPYGILDTKVLTGTDEGVSDFIAISGPPLSNSFKAGADNSDVDSQLGVPFQWSTSAFASINHLGHPDIWNFKSVHPSWIWI